MASRADASRQANEAFASLGLPVVSAEEIANGEHGQEAIGKATGVRTRRGQRTPETRFYGAILEVLAELGGAGKVADIIPRLEPKMRGVLTDGDYAPLSSTGMARWDNTARWARNSMIRNGLLKAASPWGVWEMSDRGRRFLAEGNTGSTKFLS